jgi:hypothetical protein
MHRRRVAVTLVDGIVSVAMRELIAARQGLHAIRCRPTPDLNPTDGCGHTSTQPRQPRRPRRRPPLATVRNRLKRIQYRPDLHDSFVAHTGQSVD